MKKLKTNWKSILGVVLNVILAFAVIGGIGSCTKDETDNVSMFTFERGDLDKNGEHVESKRAVYTKKAFECLGLKCIPDFDGHISYAVFYYDSEGNFLDSVTGITGTYNYDHPFATHARVVIYPDIPEDETEDDYEIPFYKVYTVANKLDITVSEKQNPKINLYDASKVKLGYESLFDECPHAVDYHSNEFYKVSSAIALNNKYTKYDIFVLCSSVPATSNGFVNVQYLSGDTVVADEGTVIDMATESAGEWVKVTIDVSDVEGAESFMVTLPIKAQCFINGYK